MRKALYVMGILDDSDVQWLASNGRRSAISKGDVLIREDQPVDALFIVLDGALEVTVGRKSVATLLAGEILGEISFVDSRPPSATVTASRNSIVLAIAHEKLDARLNSDLGFASRFFRALATFLADRLRMTTACLGYGDAAQDAEQAGGSDEIAFDMLDSASLTAVRFDRLLKRLGENSAAGQSD